VKVGVRTVVVPSGAQEGKDFKPVSEEINFLDGQEWGEVKIEIIDDDQWEPDKEFKLELFDANTNVTLE